MDNNVELDFQSRRKLEFENPNVNFDGKENVETIHSHISKEVIPEIGLEFETEEEAYNFYNTYAFKVGFSIRRSKGKSDHNGRMISRTFCWSCEGYRAKDKRDVNVKCHRAETRCGCLAKMTINSRQTGKFRVTDFIAEHKHITTSPSKSHLHRSHRKLTKAQEVEIDLSESSRVRPREAMELMAKRAGRRGSLGIIDEDYRNYLRTKRTVRMKDGEATAILECLQRMQSEDPNFTYSLKVDADDMLTNIFWADGKMRTSYYYFGDVVCFDTTYKKNKDARPFAMFVGVNHHMQTAIFGAALLYDETAETFEWLFRAFVIAMSGKKPKTMLTDQAAAMAKALISQWPETHHRLCIWHIYQNAAKQLSSIFSKFREFAKDLSCCIYDYEEEDEFIHAWDTMLVKYDLVHNDWLKRMFAIKEKWALVYGRETFCAGMTTTQRSESMNNAIKGYVSYKHDMVRFFEHFQRVVANRFYEELKVDFRVSQSSLSFEVEISRDAAKLYTPIVSKLFQAEVCKAYDSVVEKCGEKETLIQYKVINARKHFGHTVEFDSSSSKIVCSCKKFEFARILCSHALKVLAERRITKIPAQYILKRWKKDAKSGSRLSALKLTDNEDPKVLIANRYKELCRLQTLIATKAAEDEVTYNIATSGFNKILEDVEAHSKGGEVQKPGSSYVRIESETKLKE